MDGVSFHFYADDICRFLLKAEIEVRVLFQK